MNEIVEIEREDDPCVMSDMDTHVASNRSEYSAVSLHGSDSDGMGDYPQSITHSISCPAGKGRTGSFKKRDISSLQPLPPGNSDVLLKSASLGRNMWSRNVVVLPVPPIFGLQDSRNPAPPSAPHGSALPPILKGPVGEIAADNSHNSNLTGLGRAYSVIQEEPEETEEMHETRATGNTHDALSASRTESHASKGREMQRVRTCELHLVAALGSNERLQELINLHGVDMLDAHQFTPLHFACNHGRLEVVKTLLEQKATVNHASREGWTPLHVASSSCQVQVMEILLQACAMVNARDNIGWTPLHNAARMGSVEAMDVLLRQGARLDAKDLDLWQPLHVAVRFNFPAAVSFLLDKGSDINAQDREGWTGLHNAARHGHLGLANLLLERGINVFKLNRYSETALHVASRKGKMKMVERLLKHGRDRNVLHELLKVRNDQGLKASEAASSIFLKNVLHAAELEDAHAHKLKHGGSFPKLRQSGSLLMLSRASSNKSNESRNSSECQEEVSSKMCRIM
mmetsp:Transcript_2933/g.7050  ORF Transcript_2933/g.7050 Transcript_2933/m.7050 type:complete len:515 (+) Transcript_2933:223-1767(+)